ncbi:hypothetical protein ACH6EH_06790 [Paenibacillus sp. JSM ZJ436]|uniref:hypothetical protein n=1 Tax=Paenibacillus sp. JSM ZJ436 TaxID=3376190 RepID=UPI0037BD2690
MTTVLLNGKEVEEVTIQDVMEILEINNKAVMVIEDLKFFLKTNDDRINYINEYIYREMCLPKYGVISKCALAEEIGAYHYDKEIDFSVLISMSEKEALEALFVEPVSPYRVSLVYEHAVKEGETFADHFKRLYDYKKNNPKESLMNALRFM